MTVFGTRPEAIKMCPVVNELRKRNGIETIVCLTGQHKEMLDQVIDIFRIRVDYNLNIMKENQSLSMISSNILKNIDEIYEKEKPDMVLVHGDTSTAFISALAAYYKHIPIGHVEAGLRTYNIQSPFPEEFNRQGVDLISDLMFAPTERAKQQLVKEGKSDKNIYVTGNTVIDALQTTITPSYTNELLDWVGRDKMILMTAHRRENIGTPMENIFKAVAKIVEDINNVKVIYPIHMNPKVRNIARKILGDCERIKLIDPLDVIDFHNLMKRSYLIMTDSGGIQEEAPALGIPVVVMRDTTERIEGVNAGTIKLVGTDYKTIYEETIKLLTDESEYRKMSNATNPYGDGNASVYIVDAIQKYFER